MMRNLWIKFINLSAGHEKLLKYCAKHEELLKKLIDKLNPKTMEAIRVEENKGKCPIAKMQKKWQKVKRNILLK